MSCGNVVLECCFISMQRFLKSAEYFKKSEEASGRISLSYLIL